MIERNPLKKTTITPQSKAGELIGYLMYLRNCSHIAHLKTNSYPQHVALNDMYDALPDMIDTLAESIQGKLGLLDIVAPASSYEEPIECVNEAIKYIESCYGYHSETFILNQIDEILTLLYSTRYKLAFLK